MLLGHNGEVARRKISQDQGLTALDTVLQQGQELVDRATLATAVRFLLEELAELYPGGTLEVRVPPFGAVQCVAGPKHTRGTPPNVIELQGFDWINLATGRTTWQEAVANHTVQASGTRATLEGLVPFVTRNRPFLTPCGE